ncbi:MAG: DUF502 domain-containing protein [Bacteroidales bacterium]|jgi:uncharacterized membrane protein|nr:DUF502 domain-containing protein [Bacteroidales bacterium]
MTETKTKQRKVLRQLINYFLQGLLYIAPLGITLFIIYTLFGFIDGLLHTTIQNLFGIYIPGLGLVAILLIITLLGFVGQTVIAQPIKKQMTRLLNQAPLLQTIYTSIKDFFSAFVGKERKFTHPVLVKVNRSADMEKMGFITQDDLSELNLKGKVAVYFPHSYNFSGELFIVPAENITPLDIPPKDAMKFIVTGGIAKITPNKE